MRILLAFRLLLLFALLTSGAARAAEDRSFKASDGTRLHYLEAGHGHTIVFIPGWTMPAWIFEPQIAALSAHYRVIAFDPRGQGQSEIPETGYDPQRRGEDIADLLQMLGPQPVVLAGWSLGVLDVLAYVRAHGDAGFAGLVLIDNSIGEDPPPGPTHTAGPRRPLTPEQARRAFVAGMFRQKQSAAYIDRLTADSLRVPREAAAALLSYPLPRSYWKDAVYSTNKPILYAVTPHLEGQAENLARHDSHATIALFAGAGHALFVDDADLFDAMLLRFLHKIWP